MNLSELWTFISENADALGVLLALATFIGGVIGFLIKTIWGRFSKSSEQKKEKTTTGQLKALLNKKKKK